MSESRQAGSRSTGVSAAPRLITAAIRFDDWSLPGDQPLGLTIDDPKGA